MKLHHLRCFQVLAEELHFSRAAVRLHMDQSPLSRTIRELEDSLGARLFIRNAKQTLLTQEGKILLQHTRRVLFLLEEAKRDLRLAKEGHCDTLKIAISDVIDIAMLSELLRLYRQESPDVHIQICEVSPREQIIGLKEGVYDLGFTKTRVNEPDVLTEKILQDPLIVLLPLRHPLLKYKEVSLSALSAYPLVYFHPGKFSGYCEQLCHYFHQHGIQPGIIEHVQSYNMMLTLVSAGLGIGMIGQRTYFSMKNDHVLWRKLREDTLHLNTYLLYTSPARLSRFRPFIARATSSERPA